jgi:hypothetical protein
MYMFVVRAWNLSGTNMCLARFGEISEWEAKAPRPFIHRRAASLFFSHPARAAPEHAALDDEKPGVGSAVEPPPRNGYTPR